MSWELPDRISVREVGPRDGLQNEDPVPTDAKVALLDRLSAPGVQRIGAVWFLRASGIPPMPTPPGGGQAPPRAPPATSPARPPTPSGPLPPPAHHRNNPTRA